MATLKITFGCVAMLSLVIASGCRNPNGCNSPWRPFAQNTIIPPPATNSLNVSGQAGYYNPSATAANPQGNLLSNPPQGNAPNSGWAPAASNAPANQPPASNGNFGFNGPPTGNQNFQTVTASTMTGGSTQVISPDFYTTRTDERRDPSRMPMADATGVRAPSSFQSYGSFRSADQRNQPNGGYGTFTGGGYVANQNPTVLARASTAPETNPNYQNGWRPNPTNGQTSFNR